MTNDQHPIEALREMLAREIEREGTTHSFMIRAGLLADLLDELEGHRTAHSGEGRSNGAGEVTQVLLPVTLVEGFEAEQDGDTFTIRFPDGHAITARANGQLIVTKAVPGFVPFDVNVAALQSHSLPGNVEALRVALAPFAAVCDAFDYWVPEVMPNMRYPVAGTELTNAMIDCPTATGKLTEDDFRRARAALAQPEAGGE